MKDFYRLRKKPKVRANKVNLRTYDNKPIHTKGVCRASLSCNGKKVNALFVLVDGLRQPLLGLTTCIALGLIKRVHVINKEKVTQKEKPNATDWVKEYNDVFKGIGHLPGEQKIRLRADAEPVIHPARKMLVALKKRLKQKLDTLIEENVIRKIEAPTEWVNSLVILDKSDKDLRHVCIDPKDLNKSIQREHYRLPTKSDITSAMTPSTFLP